MTSHYTHRIELRAPRDRIYDAVATIEGVRSWWTRIVCGSAEPGGELHVGFDGLDEHIALRVDASRRPASVRWTCLTHSGCDAWTGSTITFELGDGSIKLCHDGVPRALVAPGWERFLASLCALVEHGAGMPFGAEALAVARAYHCAWTGRDFDAAADLLASDLQTDVPLNTYAGKPEFAAAVRGFGALVERVELIAEVGRGDEAILLYDMHTEPFGTIRIAEHFTVAGGQITRIRHVHDTVALRAAVA